MNSDRRFIARLLEVANGCIEWQGARMRGGYGSFWYGDRKVAAHRFAYERAHGQIPAGFLVLHHCDNPPCCNLDHLWLGTQSDNMVDMLAKGRGNQRRMRGVLHPNAKLTVAQVAAIRLRNEPASVSAAKYGVSSAAIYAVLEGRNWRTEAA